MAGDYEPADYESVFINSFSLGVPVDVLRRARVLFLLNQIRCEVIVLRPPPMYD